jgi:glycosyltransferase involved in cell wall biosynthesis
MKEKQYDLIILENRPGFALQLSERCNIPIISHIHTNLLYEPSVKNQKIAKATTMFLAVSKYIKNEIQKVGIKKDIRIVYNGLDSSLFNKQQSGAINRSQLGFKDNDFIAVFWGRLVPKKGIKELLLAMQQLKQHQDIKLLVIGAINYEDTSGQTNPFIDELKSIAKEIKDKVSFTGFIPYDKIADYLSIANVAVIPSRINEAFGMTCIEACAMGLPVIATNDGGIPETLVGQKHILLNKDGDLPTLIADAVLDIKTNYPIYQGNYLNPQFTKETYVKSFFNSIAEIS